ncbi:MAG: LytR/AlgR family response regulator transcription factor [Terriglobales bacterium]
MNAPSAIIAEDESLLRAEIREVLRTLWPALTIEAEVGDGISAIEALDRFAPTVAFLDIQMPGLSGLDVAQHASGKSHVVFITAFDEYALAAFERGALDYILKPLAIDRLKRTVTRLQERLRDTPANLENLIGLLKAAGGCEPRYLKWLTVPQGTELRVVAVADISYLRADNKYTTVATRSSTFLLNSSIKEMKDKLDPAMFWQIHRGTIVNVAAIETIFRSFHGSLELRLKDRSELLPVSAAHAHLFKQS